MEMDEYQATARLTKIYPKKWETFYPAIALSGEVGELNNKIGKMMRDDAPLDKEYLMKELGDCLWFISNLASDNGVLLEDIAQANIKKLKDRMTRNAIKGNGDNR